MTASRISSVYMYKSFCARRAVGTVLFRFENDPSRTIVEPTERSLGIVFGGNTLRRVVYFYRIDLAAPMNEFEDSLYGRSQSSILLLTCICIASIQRQSNAHKIDGVRVDP